MTQAPPSSLGPAPQPCADPLATLTVAVPCTVPWDTMPGDERTRHCGKCRLDVHDVSSMTRDDAVAFLFSRAPGERTCVRFHRRPDGRILTADCLEAVRAIRRRAWLAAAAVLGALGLGGAAWARANASDLAGGISDPEVWQRQPLRTLAKVLPESWIPQPVQPDMGR